MDASIGGTEPGKTVVTLLKLTGATMIIVIVETIDGTVDRITPNIGIVNGNECAGAETELQAQTAFLVEFAGVTDGETSTSTLAFPTFGGAKTDTIYGTLGIGAQIGT